MDKTETDTTKKSEVKAPPRRSARVASIASTAKKPTSPKASTSKTTKKPAAKTSPKATSPKATSPKATSPKASPKTSPKSSPKKASPVKPMKEPAPTNKTLVKSMRNALPADIYKYIIRQKLKTLRPELTSIERLVREKIVLPFMSLKYATNFPSHIEWDSDVLFQGVTARPSFWRIPIGPERAYHREEIAMWYFKPDVQAQGIAPIVNTVDPAGWPWVIHTASMTPLVFYNVLVELMTQYVKQCMKQQPDTRRPCMKYEIKYREPEPETGGTRRRYAVELPENTPFLKLDVAHDPEIKRWTEDSHVLRSTQDEDDHIITIVPFAYVMDKYGNKEGLNRLKSLGIL